MERPRRPTNAGKATLETAVALFGSDERRAAENDYRINVKAELEIELLHEKIDQSREREVVKLTDAVRMLTELPEQSAPGACESDAEGR